MYSIKKINIIGDSISLGYGLKNSEYSYVDMLNMTNIYDIKTYATCGHTLEDAIYDVNKINSYADICIIYIGNNGIMTTANLLGLINILSINNKRILICSLLGNNMNNSIIYEVAQATGISVCDIANDIRTEDCIFLEDNIHPNQNGHTLIFKCLMNTLDYESTK